MLFTLLKNRDLIFMLFLKKIKLRYRASALGIFWIFLNPLIALLIYMVAFNLIIKIKWGIAHESIIHQTLLIYIGIIVFQFFSNTLNESASLMRININFIKKTIFPLEVLPVVNLLLTIFDLIVAFILLASVYLIFFPDKNILAIYAPLLLFPLILFTFACSLVITSVSVYLSDIQHILSFFLTLVMFLSGVFFPLSLVPQILKPLVVINPISFTIGELRKVLIYHQIFDITTFFIHFILSILFVYLCFSFFNKLKKDFVNVL